MADERRSYDTETLRKLAAPFTQAKEDRSDEATEMRKNRRVSMRRQASSGSYSGPGGGSSLSFATGRPRDPMFYWKQNNLPYELDENDELAKVRAFLRLLYTSHPIIGSCVDIYTKYPTLGMEVTSKDTKIQDFYNELFFNEENGLNYDEFLLDFGREYWTVGEAIPFGSFNESLGIWDSEELLQPDDVDVEQSPFLKEPRFFIRLPHQLRRILETRSPRWEYEQLVREYPELHHYARENVKMPVSSTLLKHYRFKGDTFNRRGVPLLMRALRPIMQEEMLNNAQDAIADRLYTPLILARLGASATDLGTQTPWIPTEDDLMSFQESVDEALAADFRMLTYHFGIQMETVFGRENMPDMTADFERLEDRILQTFGLSKTMLSGASSGQTYAADALNRDLISQLLTTYQGVLKRHFRQRALVVAEAQEHYDYEERNGKRYVKMEEVLEVDEETGEEYIVEQPKLLVPELKMRTMNIKDEEAERQFLEAIRAAGIPISMKTRLTSVSIDFDEEIERTRDEQVRLAVEEQKTRKEMFQALQRETLPIPEDLAADFQPMAAQATTPAGPDMRQPMLGTDNAALTPNLAPTVQDLGVPVAGVPEPGMDTMPVDPDPDQQGDESARPEESDEMREGMPKAATLFRSATRMRKIAREHAAAVNGQGGLEDRLESLGSLQANEGQEVDQDMAAKHQAKVAEVLRYAEPPSMYATPGHVGLRRYAGVTKNTLWHNLEEDVQAEAEASND